MQANPNQKLEEAHEFETPEGAVSLVTRVDPTQEGVATIEVDGKPLTGPQAARFIGALLRAGLYSGMPKVIELPEGPNGHPLLANQFCERVLKDCVDQFVNTCLYGVVSDEGDMAAYWVISWAMQAGPQSKVLIPGQPLQSKLTKAAPVLQQLKKQGPVKTEQPTKGMLGMI